jgi:capsular polysaccharide biosynthesis protein
MELKRYLDTVWRRKWVIAITFAVTLAVVVAGTLMMRPIYTATAILRVGTVAAGSLDYVSFDTRYGDRLMNTYVQIAATRPVLDELRARLGMASLPSVTAEVIANTELIRVTANDPDPARAARAAQALAEIVVAHAVTPVGATGQSPTDTIGQQISQLEAELATLQGQYGEFTEQDSPDPGILTTLQDTIDLKQSIYATLLQQQAQLRLREALQAASLVIIEPAVAPLMPSQPNLLLNFSLGFVVALAGGFGLAFLCETLDPRPMAGAETKHLSSANPTGTASAALKPGTVARHL